MGASATLLDAIGVVSAMLPVLQPWIPPQGASLRRETHTLRVGVHEVDRDLLVLSDRAASIESTLAGPYRLPPAAPEATE